DGTFYKLVETIKKGLRDIHQREADTGRDFIGKAGKVFALASDFLGIHRSSGGSKSFRHQHPGHDKQQHGYQRHFAPIHLHPHRLRLRHNFFIRFRKIGTHTFGSSVPTSARTSSSTATVSARPERILTTSSIPERSMRAITTSLP